MHTSILRNSLIRMLILVILIPLIVEVFYFNFRFWQSKFFEKSDSYTVSVSDGMLIIDNINVNVGNIYLDVGDERDVIPLCLLVTDAASTDVRYADTMTVNFVPESKYIVVHTDKTVRTLKIVFYPSNDGIHDLDLNTATVEINAQRPFAFRPVRFLAVLIIVLLISVFRPGSKIYSIELFENTTLNKSSIMLAITAMLMLWTLFIVIYQDIPIKAYYDHVHVESIYSYQAKALYEGHTYLDIEVPDFMKDMENPYDRSLLNELAEESGITIPGDFAYYNGHFYCYYGVIPVILFYLPYYAITGEPLRNSVPVFICGFLLIISAFRFVYVIASKERKLSLGHYILLSVGLVFSSFSFYCSETPWIYSVPFIASLSFSVAGLACWFDAANMLSITTEQYKNKRVWLLLALGSICNALAFGSRPTFVFVAILSFPIFWDCIKNRFFFSRKGIANTVFILTPYLLICFALLYYNYLRFDRFLDFGAQRNLCFGMINHTFTLQSMPMGFIEYLFQPVTMNVTFPYFRSSYNWVNWMTDYQGVFFFDPFFGGIFVLAPFTVFGVLKAKENKLLRIWCLITSLILMVTDIYVVGVAMRYQIEISFFIVISALFYVLPKIKSLEDEKMKRIFHYLIIGSVTVTVVLMLMMVLPSDKPNPMFSFSPDIYYALKYLWFAPR